MRCVGNEIQYRLSNKFQMRLQYQKMKSNPFSTLKEKRSKVQIRSIEERDQIQSLGQGEKLTSEEGLKVKYRHRSFGRGKDSSVNMNLGLNCSFKDFGKELKQKRTLIEQNGELKKKIETLMHLKTSRKDSATKKFSTEFQKEVYWNGSQSYMISGIKVQYKKMKQNYNKKNEAYEDLIRSAAVSNNMEFLTYIEALEVENHVLSRQLQAITEKHKDRFNPEDQSLFIHQLEEKVAKYERSLNEYRRKNKGKGTELKKLRSKVTFLEKLIISKDNNEQNANKQMKKIEKERIDLQNRIKELEEEVYKKNKEHLNQVEKIHSYHKENIELELSKQASGYREQNEIISRLQRENRYLQNLVDSWKAEKLPSKDHHHKDHHHRDQREQYTHHSHHLLQPKDSLTTRSKIQKEQHFQQSEIITLNSPKKQTRKEQQKLLLRQHEQSQSIDYQNNRNIPYSADNKNSENSVKNRRVQAYEIQEIVEMSRLRLIARELNVDWILSQFEGNQQDEWSNEYISMGQARFILEKELFQNAAQAHLFARYLIEHSHLQYVYTDDLNEHPRAIVKSIIKALYGNYSIYLNEKTQFLQTLQHFRSKLEWLLESTTKGGIVSRDKFIDLVQSLSISCKSGFDVYCIAKMAKHSDNLQKLQYKHLFEGLAKSD